MSTIKVTNLRHESASSSNITLDSSNNVTTANNFTAGGTIGCTGDLTITSGNLVLSSGNGIDFSATSDLAGMTNELLDDYEEGTYTPTFVSSGATFSYTNQYGSYVKIGNLITVQIRLLATVSGTTSNVALMTLPVSSANLNGVSTSGCAVGLCNRTAGLTVTVDNNTSQATIWKFGTTSQATAADLNSIYLGVTCTYRTA